MKPRRSTLTRLVVAGLMGSLPLLPAPAGAQFIPYYGKNKVKYDKFDWQIYKSPHFEVFYYPAFEQHLARLTSYLESAYQKVSSDLKHEIPFSIPVIFYKTHSEFEETNLFPALLPEGVLAFAEPVRDRILLPIDLPPDKLQDTITHELTHIFEFDLIPRGLIQRSVPVWVDEGLADYEKGTWDPLDLMTIRDAAVTDQLPRLSRSADLQSFGNPRVNYNMGHAAFEFIEARYGKEGIRQFLYTLRKNIVGGSTDDIYQQAFQLKPDEFDKAFDKWMKERFKPYRDKQRPSDYGEDLAPDSERTHYTQVFAFTPSPTGELVAAITGNRAEGEADVVLLSAKDGSVIRNLTPGFTGEYQNITFDNDFVAGRSLDFGPSGDVVAFFARTGKRRSLFLKSVVDGKTVRRVPMAVDQAAAPCLLPDGKHAVFSAIKDGISDIFEVDLDTGALTNLTNDAFADSTPRVSPDGKIVVYVRRISGHDKIYVFPLDDPSRKTELTFGTYDDTAPYFSPDGNKIFYSSDADDDIFNIRSLDLRTGVVRQYTDVLGGNTAPAVIRGQDGDQALFISYFKGQYQLNEIDTGEPMKEVAQDVRTASEEVVDYQPDVEHQVVPENKRKKKLFEGLYLEGRPPLNVGVTSSGDFYGGSQVALTDVLGDQNFLFTALSLREFRSYSGTYINLASRLHYGLTVFDNTLFFYSNAYIPVFSYDLRAGVFATQRFTGAELIAQYPFDLFRRLEISAGVYKIKEQYTDPTVAAQIQAQAAAQGAAYPLRDGTIAPVTVNFVQETTRFAQFGPLSGSTFLLGVSGAAGLGGNLGHVTLETDARKYLRLGSTSALLAVRARGFRSTGNFPDIFYFGGNMEMRGYPYYSFAGNEGFFADAELRFPLINLMATPIGVLGPVRGTFFFNIGGAKFKGQQYSFASSQGGISYVKVDPNDPSTYFGEPVSGFHLVDGRASFGMGLQFFFLGYPLHFDFTKLTDLKVVSKTRFDFWVGFDF